MLTFFLEQNLSLNCQHLFIEKPRPRALARRKFLMDLGARILSFLSHIWEMLQPYAWLAYLLFGLFLFFKVFKINKKLRKRFHDFWEDLFLSKQDYCLLELKIPQALEKTPLGMEQVFAGLHGTAKGVTKYEVEVKGYLETSYSLEIASIEGRIHFYIRGERKYRTTIEALIYAQFPDIEIQEVEDYVEDAPKGLPNNEYKVVAGEFVLEKNDAYPIKTYPQFEMRTGIEAELVVDPLAGVLEAMNSLGEGEQMWLHYIIGIPMFSDWKEKTQAEIDRIMGRETEKTQEAGIIIRLIKEILRFEPHIRTRIINLILGGEYQLPEEPLDEQAVKEKSLIEAGYFRLSPGERELCLAMERNVGKLGFYTMIRFCYFAPKEIFNTNKPETLIGAFLQFNDNNLNSFKVNPNIKYTVKRPFFLNYFWKYRTVNYYLAWKHKILPIGIERLRTARMREIYNYFFNRGFGKPDRGHKGMILTTEELATIFHFPMKSVLTPELPKVEAKRGGPPARLPIE